MSELSTSKQGTRWQQIMRVVAVAVGLFALLVVGGWAFILGLGALFIRGYQTTQNRGLLAAAGSLIGMGIGTLVENMLNLVGGMAILGGLGVGLLGVYLVDRLISGRPYLWTVILGAIMTVSALLLWTGTPDQLVILNAIRTPAILLIFLGIVVEFVYERNKHTLAATKPITG
jgi:hypothetical protein